MKSYSNLIKTLEWSATGLAFIKSLIWIESNVELVMFYQNRNGKESWPNYNDEFIEMKFYFNGVTSFRFNTSEGKFHQLTGFDILDISGDGLEELNYRILDYESNNIEFFCKEIFYKKVGENILIK